MHNIYVDVWNGRLLFNAFFFLFFFLFSLFHFVVSYSKFLRFVFSLSFFWVLFLNVVRFVCISHIWVFYIYRSFRWKYVFYFTHDLFPFLVKKASCFCYYTFIHLAAKQMNISVFIKSLLIEFTRIVRTTAGRYFSLILLFFTFIRHRFISKM